MYTRSLIDFSTSLQKTVKTLQEFIKSLSYQISRIFKDLLGISKTSLPSIVKDFDCYL